MSLATAFQVNAALPELPGESGNDSESLPAWIESPTVEDDAEFENRFQEWLTEFNVSGEFGRYQLRMLVIESFRLSRCHDEENALFAREKAHAQVCWDEDRTAEVHAIVAKLHRNPERWRNELVRTAQGCRWLIEQWQALAEVLASGRTWDERQRSRALDLLGVAPICRETCTDLDPPPGAPEKHLEAQIEREIAALRGKRKDAEKLDAFHCAQALRGMRITQDRELQAIRRYEAGCHRRFARLYQELSTKPTRLTAQAAPRPKVVESAPIPWIASTHQPVETLTNKTEQCSIRRDPAPAPSPTDVPAEEKPFAGTTLQRSPFQVSSTNGNRRARRRAEAQARRQQ